MRSAYSSISSFCLQTTSSAFRLNLCDSKIYWYSQRNSTSKVVVSRQLISSIVLLSQSFFSLSIAVHASFKYFSTDGALFGTVHVIADASAVNASTVVVNSVVRLSVITHFAFQSFSKYPIWWRCGESNSGPNNKFHNVYEYSLCFKIQFKIFHKQNILNLFI